MSFEQPPTIDSGVESDASLEQILERGASQTERMGRDESHLYRTLENIRPENETDQRAIDSLRARIDGLSAVRGDVETAVRAVALETAVKNLENTKDPVEVEDVMQVFDTYPELAEAFLEHVLETKHLKAPSAQLVKDVESAIDDFKGADGKMVRGLALRTTERVLRAVISAGTLGVGAVVYDCVKDAYVSIRARNTARARAREALMNSSSSAALPQA